MIGAPAPGRMRERRVALRVDGAQLSGVLCAPEESPTTAAALLLHGGPGGTKQGPGSLFVRLAASLAAAGIASARFDFLGCGESGGDYVTTSPGDQVAQYRHMIGWLRSEGYPRTGVVGESFGATCALGGYRPSEVDALVLLWPAIWLLDEAFAPFVTRARQAEVREHGSFSSDGQRIGRAFVDDLLGNDNRANALTTIAAPTLLIHGDADADVPVRQSHRALELLREPKRLIIVPGADHCLGRADEQALAVRETTRWLTSHLAHGG